MAIEFYKEFGELGYLASYSNHGFFKNGIYYKTVEHYYQSEKFDNKKLKEKIINCSTPKEASIIGRDRNNIRRKDFDKLKTMYDAVYEKFNQNRDILYKLIETRNEVIIEKTTKENYWGIGPNNDGENHYGLILMEVRDRLKKELLHTIINNCGEEVYVLGHNNPDCDSLFSSILLRNILSKFNIRTHFCILDKDYDYNLNDIKLINDYLKEKPEILSNTTNKKFLLVDHNTLDGFDKDSVIGCIDHHIISNQVYNTLEIEYASTGLFIYDLFKDIYNFSKEEKLLIGFTVLADTEYLCSARYKKEDKILFDSLKLNINVKELQSKYFVTTNLKNSINENINSNLKRYNRNDKIINRVLITSYTDDKKNYLDKYIEYINNLDGDYLLIWADYENLDTTIYYNNTIYTLDYLTTSTYIVFKYLEENKGISKIYI